ncbi:unnamed protein product [Rotaria sp. Silwood2]|nr:unnamed protein product [Rotaria sp. Silwood2]CAF3214684.1 unnamed protein product [Rotaria sp. Silwood2]CAF4040029.1 unnamed protein product [Rotaria sp. Silwood2]CAF4145998.1 unnamed protein product [Rotaria sp. Silwood2]
MGVSVRSSFKFWSQKEFGKGTIEVEKGDITAERVHVIVGTSSSQRLKEIILEAAGDVAKTAYKTELEKNPIPILISLPPGQLSCKRIFFVKWRPEKNETLLEKSITDFVCNTIKNVASHDFTSVAFPAIGCGLHGFPVDVLAKT